MIRTTLIAFIITLPSIVHAQPAEFTIVRDGHHACAIMIPPNSSAAVTFAATEIQEYISAMSGEILLYVEGNLIVGPTILISPDRAIAGGSIALDDEVLRITGGSDLEVLHAAYRFLDLLGCRFLAPQFDHYRGAAEVIPKKTILTLTLDKPIVSPAKLAYRKLYIEEGISHDESNLKQLIEWMPKVGYNVLVCPMDYGNKGRVKWDNWRDALTPELQKRGIIIEVGGHGYENFLNAEMDGGKHFAEHPEWFGADEKGTRRKQNAYAFCTSNAEAVAFVTKNFLDYVAKRPEIQIFDFWPPDGAKWCECAPCKSLGEPPERQAKLISHVAREVAKVRPDLKLEAIAYSKLIEPPKLEKIDKNVLIDFCPIAQNFEFTIDDSAGHGMREDGVTPRANKQYFDALKAWRERFDGPISIYSYYRRYAWDSLPLVLPWHMKREMAWYASVPTQGISTYSEPGDWFTYELNHYVLPALAWDGDQDVDALVKKFCDARYGEASLAAATTYKMLAEVVPKHCGVPFVSLKSSEAITNAASHTDAVAKQLAAIHRKWPDDDVRRHLERFSLVVEYVQRDLAVQKMRAARAPREEIRKRIAADHRWLSDHASDGVVLLKGHRLNLERAYRRYGVSDKATTSPTE